MNILEQAIKEKEDSLLQLQVRSNPEKLKSLLAESFIEIGFTAKIYSREEILQQLARETPDIGWSMSDFQIRQISADVVLATYKVTKRMKDGSAMQITQRSSIWKNIEDDWKMFFHQSTVVPNGID